MTTRTATTIPPTAKARIRNRFGVPLAAAAIACAVVACVYASPAGMLVGALACMPILLGDYVAVRRLAAAVESALAALVAVAVRIATRIDSTTTAASSADLALAFMRRMQDAARTARASRDALRARTSVVHVSLTPRAVSRALAVAA